MAESRVNTAAGNADMAAAWNGPEGDHWADNAACYDSTSIAYRRALLAALDLQAHSSVLDIGCGAGWTTLEVARVASEGTVLGVDLSTRMLAVGRAAATDEGLEHVRFEQADAQVHPFEPASFDVAISSFGAMFFADPVAAFANIRRSLRPGGSMVLLAWRELARNEWVSSVRAALAAGRDLPTPPPGAQGPFSMADRDITTERLVAAGFQGVEFTSIDAAVCFGRDLEEAYSFVSTFGITRGLTADLGDDARDAALEQLRRSLEAHQTADGVLYDGSAWLITARNDEGS